MKRLFKDLLNYNFYGKKNLTKKDTENVIEKFAQNCNKEMYGWNFYGCCKRRTFYPLHGIFVISRCAWKDDLFNIFVKVNNLVTSIPISRTVKNMFNMPSIKNTHFNRLHFLYDIFNFFFWIQMEYFILS